MRTLLLLKETRSINDYPFYDAMISNSGHWIPNNDAVLGINEYSNNGWKYGQSDKYTRLECDYPITKPFEIYYEITDMNSSHTCAVFISPSNLVNNFPQSIELRGTSNITVYNGSILGKYNLKVYSNYMELFKDGIKLGQVNLNSDSTFKLALESGTQNGRWIRLKNFIIK